MNATQWMALGAGILLVAFIAFAFRQGTKVKPDRSNRDNWQTSGVDSQSSDGHHGS
jgi:hypothetical protein